jgi:ABC-type antimicrobial peptide transport system permease subunit
MFQFKINLRNLQRGGIYSAINIGGLAIGMAAAILILAWIYHEWSYDRFHAKEKQLYQVWYRVKNDGPVECHNRTSILAAPALKSDYPDIVEATRVIPTDMLCAVGDHSFKVQTALVDPGFLSMFSFPLLHGNAGSALNDQFSMILTEKIAKRLFGDDDPMGQTILVNNNQPMTVTGIMKDLPNNTTFEFEALASATIVEKNWSQWWGNHTIPTYVELHPQAQEAHINESIKNLIRERTNNDVDAEMFVFPLNKSHLYTKSENGVLTGGLIDTLRLFGLVAFLILLIACINFMNLSTARSNKRAKEVGVRKVMGGKRLSLIRLFLSESTLLAFIAGAIAIVIVLMVLPAYNVLLGKTLSLDLTNGWFWLAVLGFILFTGFLAGSYPALYLSSFLPVKVLKGIFSGKKQLIAPRRALVILQFTVAIFLITATLVIHRQVLYAQSRDNGYRKEHLIYHPMTGNIGKNYELIKHDLLSSGIATSVTKTFAPMTEQWANATGVKWRGGEPDSKVPIDIFFADADWVQTVGTTIVEGRDMDLTNFPTDSTAALLNESAVRTMGFDNPVGEEVEFWAGKVHVVGVIKDFILHSPYDPTQPMIIAGPGVGFFSTLHIRLNGANKMVDNLAKAEAIFKEYNPAYPFEYNFIDMEYARKFQEEKTMGALSTWFAGLTILISCLGLFALVAYLAETRRKEIGIRKVLGASVSSIMILLSKEFLILVLISVAVASPVAWWAMEKWLSNYAYRTDIPWWLFVMVGCISLCIALLTVGFQAIRAATENPVKAIKSE